MQPQEGAVCNPDSLAFVGALALGEERPITREGNRVEFKAPNTEDELEHSLDKHPNELSLISRLPRELLASIFMHTKNVELPKNQWIRVSHVCSHWRRVALEYPFLWADLTFENAELAEHMLALSDPVPLNISPRFTRTDELSSFGNRVAALRNALTQFPRIRSLRLQEYSIDPETYQFMSILQLLKGPAPLLEKCCIHFHFAGSQDAHKLPDSMLRDSPRLTHLILRYGCLNWESLSANLRVLKVRHIPFDHRPQMEHICSALSHLSRLEILSLLNTFAPTNGSSIVSSTTIHFPRLQKLSIECPLVECAQLLERLAYPNTVRVEISPEVDEDMWENPQYDKPLFYETVLCLEKRLPEPIASLYLSMSSSISFSPYMDGTISERPPSEGGSSYATIYAFNIGHVALYGVLQHLYLGKLTSLTINNIVMDAEKLVYYFGHLDTLTEIEARTASFNFVDALSNGISALSVMFEQDSLNKDLKFKALRRLKLRGSMWDRIDSWTQSNPKRKWGDCVIGSLRARQRAGATPLHVALFDYSELRNDYVSALEKVVEHLEFVDEPDLVHSESEEDKDWWH